LTDTRTPDDSTEIHLDELSVPEVTLTRDSTERLITAIQKLGKSNLRLADEFRSMKWVIWAVMVLLLVVVLTVGGTAWSVYSARVTLGEVVDRQNANVKAIGGLARQLTDIATNAAAARQEVAEIPRIDVVPANPADPTSKPVAVVIPGKAPKEDESVRPRSTSAPVQIPLTLPSASQ